MTNTFFKLIGALALLGFGTLGNAASLSITGPADATEGDQFQLQIAGDFSVEGFVAGGVTFSWDDALVQLDNIALDLGDPDFSCPGALGCPPDTANSAAVIWGGFNDLIAPGAGPTLMATLTFTAIAPGPADFSMVSANDVTGGWFGAGFTPINDPALGDFSMQVNPVPLPAAAWLFGSALLGLVGLKRRLA